MANVGDISVTLGIDTSDFTSALTEVERAAQQAGQQFENVGNGLQDSIQDAGNQAENSFAQMLAASNKVWVSMSDGTRAFIDSQGKLRNANGTMRTDIDGIRETYQQAMNGSTEAIERLRRAMDGVQQETQETTNDGVKGFARLRQAIKEAWQNAEEMGEKLQDVGEKMTKSLALPLTGLATASSFVASEYETANAHIQNSLAVTAQEAEELTKIASNIYKEGYGESFPDIQRALIQTRQNMQGLEGEELQKATKHAQLLAQTFDADVNEVTRAGGNIMKSFGIEADEAFDLMSWGAKNGMNFSNEMFDNLAEYAPLFGEMGISAEEYISTLQKATSAGVYNLDFVNDFFKEFQIKIKDGSKGVSDAMDLLSKDTQNVWKNFNQGKGTVKDVHNAVIKELKGMDNQILANEIGVGLYGKHKCRIKIAG